MKLLKYTIIQNQNTETESEPKLHNVCVGPLSDAAFQANYAMAQAEAYNGEVTVEEIPDLETEPTQEEDTAAMLVDHEFRLTLLELGLNEA